MDNFLTKIAPVIRCGVKRKKEHYNKGVKDASHNVPRKSRQECMAVLGDQYHGWVKHQILPYT